MIDVRGIDNVLFAVGNFEEAERFYGQLLGLVTAFAFCEAGMVGYRLGEEEPGLMIREQPHLAPGPARETPRLWPEVPDARASANVLAYAGVRLLDQPKEMRSGWWFVEFADPWGNVIDLTDYRNDPARARGG
jgi:predicted enzyme related to lactoylglutathione lyase